MLVRTSQIFRYSDRHCSRNKTEKRIGFMSSTLSHWLMDHGGWSTCASEAMDQPSLYV